ncbi:MAG: iron ABC transporter substrate-binding protein [Spirochaetes bacterium]|nr:MAG: iron ABC transporter substrate-binding protein [Spirochaetota bacterium]
MFNKYFSLTDTLFEITEKYPQTVPVFTANGFPQMGDAAKRADFGKKINLETALTFQKRDTDSFAQLLVTAIEGLGDEDVTLSGSKTSGNSENLKIAGLLPCPVRIPLMESFKKFSKEYTQEYGIALDYELKAASMGVEWIDDNLSEITDPSGIPDLFISAGFDLFFDEEKIGKFKKNGVFKDLVPDVKINSSFDGYDLKDPRGHYSMIGVVPAVFLVNLKDLGDRKVPRTWGDILGKEFENSVSLPVGDFDLFNGMLLNIHKRFGPEGVRKLGRSLLESLHPSQMVKSDRKTVNRPVITILPYFFTKTVREGSTMTAVWPEDGAIISPLFMLAKAEKEDKLKEVVTFFASREVGEILSHQGLFPSTNPEVDNRLDENKLFSWLGWDYIYSTDIAGTIKECEALFEESVTERIEA